MRGWKMTLWVAILIVALFFLYLVRSILLPFTLAVIISALLDPTIYKLRLKGFSRRSAVSLVFFGFFTLAATVIIYLTPIVSGQFIKFQERLDFYVQKLAQQNSADSIFMNWNPVVQAGVVETGVIERLLAENHDILHKLGIPVTKSEIVSQYVEPYRTEIVRAVRSLFTGFINIAASLAPQFLFVLITPLIVFMILMDLDRFKSRGLSWIPPSIRGDTTAIIRDIGQVFLNYLKGVALVYAFYSIGTSMMLSVLEAPYSVLLALIFGALYLIPYIGSWISGSTLLLVIGLGGLQSNWMFQFSSPWVYAAVVTGIFLIFSMIFDQAMYPRLIGKYIGLHPVTSMFVIFSGGALFGLVGMILAFPLAGSIKVILDRLMKITSADYENAVNLPAIPMRHRNITSA
jgi:predicted PurR-regulated permease PerM